MAVGAAVVLTASACSSSKSNGNATANAAAPIKIGYITSATGIASSSFADGAAGAQARIDAQNAAGGIDGHKLQLIVKDDQSNPSLDQVEAKDLVSQGVFGMIEFSPFAFEAARFLQQQGVPVTGEEFDGPEWGQQPYTNMFSWSAPLDSPFSGKYYSYDGDAKYLKTLGVTKLASLTYQVPSSLEAVFDLVGPAKTLGISDCYDNLNVPFGGTDFTADVLAIKSRGCDAVQSPVVTSSAVAVAEALKQDGLSPVQIYYTGYSQDVLDNPAATAALQNAYVVSTVNFVTPNAATAKMVSDFQRYDPSNHGGVPDIGLYGSYIAAQQMIDGLKLAGSPSRTGFIAAMHKQTDYTADGIFQTGVNYAAFATPDMLPQTGCGWLLQLKGHQFVLANGGQPVCGQRVPAPGPSS
jgi:branched-chain amino acid transport system substrate-binding protein